MEQNEAIKKLNILKWITAVGFIISAYFTWKIYWEQSSGIDSLVNTAMVLVLEFAKCYFMFVAVIGILPMPGIRIKVPSSVRGVLFIIAICLFASSIMASAQHIQGQAVNKQNEAMMESDAYKNQKESNANNKDLYEQKKKEIDNYKTSEQARIDSIRADAAKLPENYITMRSNKLKEADEATSIMNNKLIEMNKELENISGKLNTDLKKDVAEIKNTNSPFIKSVTEWINGLEAYKDKKNKWTYEQVQTTWYLAIGILFEFCALLIFLLSSLATASIEKGTSITTVGNNKVYNQPQSIRVEELPNQSEQQRIGQKVSLEKPVKKNEIMATSAKNLENISNESNKKKDELKIGFHYDGNDKKPAVIVKPNRKIGFDYVNKDIKGIQVWQVNYLKELYDLNNHTERFGAPGYTKISKLLGINRNDASNFRAALAVLNIIQTGENNSNKLIIKDFKTALRKVSRSILENGGMQK